MTAVTVTSLRKAYPGQHDEVAIADLDLQIAEGEFLVLLGPSGCGKTTALRCLAGLERPDAGRITIGPTVVFDADRKIELQPDKRDIGMVFQSYALWPHKTVRENVAYPLRARRRSEGLRGGWVEEAARLVECEHLMDRYPAQLSGGQQQRIALARAFVARPGLLLFDEPLSNLDARLRDQVRLELHELHRRLGFTGVYVTHDQSEGLALADRLAVMRHGRIEQLAVPSEVYEHPATDYVAAFMGFVNRVELKRSASGWRTSDGDMAGMVPEVPSQVESFWVRSRPEDVIVVPAGEAPPGGSTAIPGCTLLDVTYGGRTLDLLVEAGTTRLRARVRGAETDPRCLAVGSAVTVAVQVEELRTYDTGGAELRVAWRSAVAEPQ